MSRAGKYALRKSLHLKLMKFWFQMWNKIWKKEMLRNKLSMSNEGALEREFVCPSVRMRYVHVCGTEQSIYKSNNVEMLKQYILMEKSLQRGRLWWWNCVLHPFQQFKLNWMFRFDYILAKAEMIEVVYTLSAMGDNYRLHYIH